MDVAAHAKALRPKYGDVVVRREVHSAARFTVSQVPSVAQLQASGRDDAMALARSFARSAAVDVWYCDNGTHRLLEAYRR